MLKLLQYAKSEDIIDKINEIIDEINAHVTMRELKQNGKPKRRNKRRKEIA